MVEDGAFFHKIDHVTILKEILNLKGHPNCITGSKAVKGLHLQPAQQACCIRQIKETQVGCF